jgi:hypothetical protein
MKYVLLKSISSADRSRGIDITSLYEVFEHDSSYTIQRIAKNKQVISWSVDNLDLLPLDDNRITDPEYIAEIIKSLPLPTEDTFRHCCEIEEYSSNCQDILLLYAQNKYERLSNTVIEDKVVLREHISVSNELVDYKKVITDYFGTERVSFDLSRFFIHFPEKVITNSNGKKHTMYDIYMQVELHQINSNDNNDRNTLYSRLIDPTEKSLVSKNENPSFYLAYGTRTRVSPEEHQANYMFSHIQQKKHGWSSTCLGQDVLNAYRSRPISSEEDVLGFCMALEVYLSWESLELGPYVKISYITPVRPTAASRRDARKMALEVIKSLMHSELENTIENVNPDFSVQLNTSKLDEVNPFFEINGEYIDKQQLLESGSLPSSTKHVTFYGEDFFNFNGVNKGKVSIDYSLSKTKKETMLLGELTKHKDFYPIVQTTIQDSLKKILIDDTNKYLKKKSTFNLNSI